MTTLTRRASQHTLSRHPPGSIREMLALSVPLVFSIFSGSLMSFCDRLFISHYALHSLKAVTTANYFCLLFQVGISGIASMAQVCIGKSYGERKRALLGPYCWQMIWFSFFSMAITLPLGLGLAPRLFRATEIAFDGSLYFTILMYGNFLFPLGTTLSAYFTGLGKTKLVGICAFGAQVVNIGLNYLLIFGAFSKIPPLGVKGAALGTVFSQAILCFALLVLFLKEPREHGISKRSINKALFKEVLFLGLPKSLARTLGFVFWALVVNLVTRLGGDYLLVLSIGCSVWLIYSPIIQAIEQVLIAQVAFYRGKKDYAIIWKAVRSSTTVLFGCFLLLGIFFLLCLENFLSFFIHEAVQPQALAFVRLSCLWLWIFFFLEGVNAIALGLLAGLSLTWFRLRLSIVSNVLTAYPFHYLGFQYWHLNPDKIWMLCWICMVFPVPIALTKAKNHIKSLAARQDTSAKA